MGRWTPLNPRMQPAFMPSDKLPLSQNPANFLVLQIPGPSDSGFLSVHYRNLVVTKQQISLSNCRELPHSEGRRPYSPGWITQQARKMPLIASKAVNLTSNHLTATKIPGGLQTQQAVSYTKSNLTQGFAYSILLQDRIYYFHSFILFLRNRVSLCNRALVVLKITL